MKQAINLKTLTIIDLDYNEDGVSYIITLSDSRMVNIQFELETNRLDADYNTYYPKIEYCKDLTDEEKEEIKEFMNENQEISLKCKELE